MDQEVEKYWRFYVSLTFDIDLLLTILLLQFLLFGNNEAAIKFSKNTAKYIYSSAQILPNTPKEFLCLKCIVKKKEWEGGA